MKHRKVKTGVLLLVLGLLFQAGLCGPAFGAESGPEEGLRVERTGDDLLISGSFAGDTAYATLLALYPGQELTLEYDAVVDATGMISGARILNVTDGDFRCVLPVGKDGPFGVYRIFVLYGGQKYEASFRFTKSGAAYKDELKQKLNGGAAVLDTLLEYQELTLLDAAWFAGAPRELAAYFEERVRALLPAEDMDAFLARTEAEAELVYAMDEVNRAKTREALAAALQKHKARFSLAFDAGEADAASLLDQTLKELPYYTAEAFEALSGRYILTKVNAASWGGYHDLFVQYAEIGIADMDAELKGLSASQQNALFRHLAQLAPFDSLDAFRQGFLSARSWVKAQQGSGTGGGAGGGRISSGTSSGGPVTAVQEPQNMEPSPAESPFADLAAVPWARESIAYLASVGAVSGVGGGRFEPMGPVKREEFLKMALNVFGYTVRSGRTPFADVERDAWYENYVYTACSEAVVNGVSETLFGVGDPITRQDAAVLLTRIFSGVDKRLDVTPGGALPGDLGQTADYAADAVAAMFKAGVLSGDENGDFQPQSQLTRAEAAKMIYGVLNSVR